jgi:hypothetical protein
MSYLLLNVDLELEVKIICHVFKIKATARTVMTIKVMRMMMMIITTVSFMLIIRVIFFSESSTLTANFPLFSANLNVIVLCLN